MLTDEPFPLNGEGFRLGWKLVDLSDKINRLVVSSLVAWEVGRLEILVGSLYLFPRLKWRWFELRNYKFLNEEIIGQLEKRSTQLLIRAIYEAI